MTEDFCPAVYLSDILWQARWKVTSCSSFLRVNFSLRFFFRSKRPRNKQLVASLNANKLACQSTYGRWPPGKFRNRLQIWYTDRKYCMARARKFMKSIRDYRISSATGFVPYYKIGGRSNRSRLEITKNFTPHSFQIKREITDGSDLREPPRRGRLGVRGSRPYAPITATD